MLFEQLGGGFVRIRANYHKGSHVVAYILNTLVGYLFRFTERSSHADNSGLVLFAPRLPSRYSLSLLCESFCSGKSVPRGHSRASLTAEKDGEIGVVRAHEASYSLRVAVQNKKLDIATYMIDAGGPIQTDATSQKPQDSMGASHRDGVDLMRTNGTTISS
jgi:hypothetical protein